MKLSSILNFFKFKRTKPMPSPHASSPAPNASFSPSFTDLPCRGNGKIARLPRDLREKVNHCLAAGFPSYEIAAWLNQLPQVKAVMACHFKNKPIRPQNINEWRASGFRDWLARQELLQNQAERTADVAELAATAEGTPDTLFKLLTLDYARLLEARDKETPEDFEKKRHTLSLLAQDIARLHRCDINGRRVEVQEAKLDRQDRLTNEQLLYKFVQWNENPEVRRALVLEPLERMRRLREIYGMPPAPEDPLVAAELHGYSRPHKKHKNKAEPPKNHGESTKKTEPSSPSDAEVGRGTPCPPSSPPQTPPTVPAATQTTASSSISPMSPIRPISEPEPQKVESTSASEALHTSLLGKTKEQTIAEIEEQCVRKTKPTPPNAPHASSPTPRAPTQPSPYLSDYERARLAGKSHIEAMEIQFTPTPALLEHRKREHQALKDAAANASATIFYHSSFGGPAPAPIRPGDRWKVQTA